VQLQGILFNDESHTVPKVNPTFCYQILQMMIKRKQLIILTLLWVTALPVWAQHDAASEHAKPFKPFHSLGVAIGHAHSFKGVDENGGRKNMALPYFGLDYNFQFAPKWALGLHTDFINETFVVEKTEPDGTVEELERSRPIAPALMAMYNLSHRWKLGFGMGGEFASEGNFWLNRAAIEYACPIRKGWEVFGALQYDIRWSAYDTWTIGLGIAYAFGEE
jgi:hypothetical protein